MNKDKMGCGGKFLDWCKRAWKMGKDDPRKFIHAVKVGGALCLVSPLYLTEPVFKGFAGSNAIWAVVTVVVVFEFSAGATLYKGLNRALGTFAAGLLGLLVGYLARNCNVPRVRAIIIGIAIFLFGATVTYFRFMPRIKAKFDYGMVIFLLTFNMILMSSYRQNDILTMAYHRFVLVLIGIGICFLISWIFFPIWAGEDLHQCIVNNLHQLNSAFKDCVDSYFEESGASCLREEEEENSEDPIYERYRTILNAKAAVESLANFAKWEIGHGRFRFRHPWQCYVRVGTMIRHCAYTVVALHGLMASQIQTPRSTRNLFKKQCIKLSTEALKVLEELADSVEQMTQCRSPESMLKNVELAVNQVHAAFGSEPLLFVDSRRWSVREIADRNQENAKQAERRTEDTEKGRCLSDVKSMGRTEMTGNTPQLRNTHGIRIDSSHGPEALEKENPATGQLKQNVFLTCSASNLRRRFQDTNFASAFPLATFASLMVEFTARLLPLAQEIERLGKRARFKAPNQEDEEEQMPRRQNLYSKSMNKSRRDVANNHSIDTHAG